MLNEFEFPRYVLGMIFLLMYLYFVMLLSLPMVVLSILCKIENLFCFLPNLKLPFDSEVSAYIGIVSRLSSIKVFKKFIIRYPSCLSLVVIFKS